MSIKEIRTIDDHGARVVDGIGHLSIPSWIASKITNLNPSVKTSPDQTKILDDAIKAVKNIYTGFKQYHQQILQSSSLWSTEINQGMTACAKWVLYPFACGKIGRAAQRVIAENVVGSTAQVVSFCAFQFFHTLPYLMALAFSSGVYFLYQTAPVALITSLAATMLVIQIYLILELVKKSDEAKEIIKAQANIVNTSLRSYEPLVLVGKVLAGAYILTSLYQNVPSMWSTIKALPSLLR